MNAKTLKLIGTTALTAGLLAAIAPGAFASSVTISGGNRVNVTAPGSERNQIVVAYDMVGDLYTVTDAAGINGTGTCTDVNDTTVNCPGLGVASITVNAGSGNDTITIDATVPATIESTLTGGSGDDRLLGARAADDLNGGNGRDSLDGMNGADILRGGGGSADTLFYGSRTTALAVTVGQRSGDDGNELDVTGADRDTVRGDVEIVILGSGSDRIVGDSSSETFVGGLGNDTLAGERGSDTLLGDAGNDFLSGERGNDTLRGSLGNDTLMAGSDNDRAAGGAGDDLIRGKSGADIMKGKTGIDVILAKDGTRDIKINCGPGPNNQEFARRDKGIDPRPRSC